MPRRPKSQPTKPALTRRQRRYRRLVIAGLASGVLMLVFILSAVFGTGDLTEQFEARNTQGWTSKAPDALTGTWATNRRQCTLDEGAQLVFSDGGYRWRRDDGSWGFARGNYSYTGANPFRILFKLRRINPRPGYEAILTLSGTQLRKFNVLSSTSERYVRCPD